MQIFLRLMLLFQQNQAMMVSENTSIICSQYFDGGHCKTICVYLIECITYKVMVSAIKTSQK